LSNPITRHVPPCVERMIARTEWFSDPGTVARAKLAPAKGIARLLSSRFFARTEIGAITLGSTIYFRDLDIYNPHTAKGLAFLAHEIKHIEQFERHGLVGFYFQYLGGYFRRGYGRGIGFEDEAYGFQKVVRQHLDAEFQANPGVATCQELDEPHTPNAAFVRTVPAVFIYPSPPSNDD